MSKIAIIGAGSWGTALAHALASAGHDTRLWAYETEVVASICDSRENSFFLPDILLSKNITPTNDLAFALSMAEIVLTVMPSHVCRSIY